jgi:hypothetical protein
MVPYEIWDHVIFTRGHFVMNVPSINDKVCRGWDGCMRMGVLTRGELGDAAVWRRDNGLTAVAVQLATTAARRWRTSRAENGSRYAAPGQRQ